MPDFGTIDPAILALINASNTFTQIQKIAVDNGIQMTFYRPVSTGGFGAGFYYNFNNLAGTEVTYGNEYVSIEDNTTGSHRGDFNVQLSIASSLGMRFRVFTSGNGGIIFGNNQRFLLSETGLTAQRTWVAPDADGTFVGLTNTQTITNKTFTTPTLTTPTINGTKFALPAAKTADYTATTTDYYIPVTCSSVNITITLPAASGNAGLAYVVYKTDNTAFTVIVDGNASETINGATTYVLRARYQHVRLECDGSGWFATRDTRMTDDTTNNLLGFAASVLFTNAQLFITDSDGTNNYNLKGGDITGGGGAKIVNLPDISAATTLVSIDTAQNLTNKTIGDIKENWVGKSTTYTMTDADYGIMCTGTSTYTITLPAVSGRTGKVFQFVKTGASGTITIDGNASETINGAANTTLTTQYQKMKILCTGTEWLIISD